MNVEKKFIKGDAEKEQVDLTLSGRNAELNVKLQSRFPDKVKSGKIKFNIDFGKADFSDSYPVLLQTLYLPVINKVENKFTSSEIMKSIEGKKSLISSFDVKVDSFIPMASLSSELTYQGYSRAKFSGCITMGLDDYDIKCGGLGKSLVDSNIPGSEFKINEISVADINTEETNSYTFYISFTNIKKGDVENLDISFENFPFLKDSECRASLDEDDNKNIKWKNEREGETYCKVYLDRSLNLENGVKKFDGYLWMKYDYSLKKDVKFAIEP